MTTPNQPKLSELIAKANFSYVSDWATDENFPISDSTKPMELYQPPKTIAGPKVLEVFKNTGYEPGKIEHIVQYAIDHPNNDEKLSYVGALGSTYRVSVGDLYVPCLRWVGEQWILRFCWLGGDWNDDDRVVRCKSDFGISEPRPSGTRTLGTEKLLRDEFAMAALQGLITNQGWSSIPNKIGGQVFWAYEYADRMLAQRAKADNQS